jgi:hypothetical protein
MLRAGVNVSSGYGWWQVLDLHQSVAAKVAVGWQRYECTVTDVLSGNTGQVMLAGQNSRGL